MNARMRNCGIGATLAVDADGTAYPCAIPYLAIGSAMREPFDEPMGKLKTLRESTTIDNFPGCQDCDIRYVCLGGCRVSHYLKRQTFLDPACTPQKRERKYRHMAHMIPVVLKD